MTVGYTRLSIDKYDDHLAVTRQRQDISALAQTLNWPGVTSFYEDNDVSANTDKRRPRPGFDRLLSDMRAGRVTHVLVYDQDRLVRDMRQLEDVVDAVEAGKVLLTSVNGDIDLRSDNGRMVARIKAAVARNELEKLSRRIKRQKLQRAQSGLKTQTVHRPYGYDRDWTIVPEEAAVIRRLFRRKAHGESVASLVRWLNQTRVRSVTGLEGHWQHSLVTTMLRRREYAGEVTLNGQVVATAAFKAIVTRRLFDEVQAALPVSPPPWRALKETGLLTGLLVCGMCGTRMRRGRGKKTSRTYYCKGTTHPTRRLIISTSVDRAVVQAVEAKMGTLADGGSWQSAQASAIEHEIEQARRQHARGALTRAELDSVLKHLSARLMAERRVPIGSKETAELPQDWPLDAKRDWLASLVDKIVVAEAPRIHHRPTVYLDRVTIHFKDGRTLDLGRPHITQDDVARHLGLSRKTVCDALCGNGRLSGSTRERVRAAAIDLGYDHASYHRSVD